MNHDTHRSRIAEWADLVGASLPDAIPDDHEDSRLEATSDQPT